MKRLAIAVVILLIIGIATYLGATNKPGRTVNTRAASDQQAAPQSPYDPQAASTIAEYLATHKNYGRITIAEWQKMSREAQTFLSTNLVIGVNAGWAILGTDTTPESRTDRLDLLEGWNRPTKDYAKEIDKAMQQPGGEKSIVAALINAQIKFAEEAGQTQKAQALQTALQSLPANIKSGQPSGKPGAGITDTQLWQIAKTRYTTEQLTAGLLDGIALTNAAMHQGSGIPGIPISEPMKFTDKMREESKNLQPTDKLIYLYETTAAKLPAQPTGN